MTSSITRRALLGAAALLPLAACARGTAPVAAPPSSAPERHARLVELERKFDARLGVFALDTGKGTVIAHRADERFSMASTFKVVAAAAVLHRNPLSHLDTVVTYGEADLMEHAPIARQHVATGMTIRDLCDAAIRYSDGTAANLLLRDIGGPDQLTIYTRGLGDTVTRMDRIEPVVADPTPGDVRGTTSPRAFGTNYQKIVLGDALPADKRALLRDLLERNTTGDKRIRAGVPTGWTVADKTGTADYGTVNDIGVVWPPNAAPLVVAIMSSKAAQDAEYDEALVAEAAGYVVTALT